MLGLGCYQVLEQRNYLSQEQRLALKQLIRLELILTHPENPDMIRGLEGMKVAHRILQEREATGVLIGGLSEAVWNMRRKPGELYKHKDVDVMVLDDHFELEEDFEGGIDWWLQQQGPVEAISRYGSLILDPNARWWENGNGMVLSFGARKEYDLEPGLYIPDSEWVVDMRETEAVANVYLGDVEFDGCVSEKFREHVRKRVKTRLPKFIEQEFKGCILSPLYEWDDKAYAVELKQIDQEILRAIRGPQEID